MVVADFSLWGDILQEYITILENSTAEYSEKHSRFIAIVQHCESEAQAAELILGIKSKYWDARHNVYAYVLQNGTVRFSDDGEPHGTAGKPILDCLNGMGLNDVAVVVTRYFGGVLLGTGGLVRAYSKSAKDALLSAVKAQKTLCKKIYIKCPYSYHTQLTNLLKDYGASVDGTKFAAEVEITCYLKNEIYEDFEKNLTEVFSGKITAQVQGEKLFLTEIK